MRERNFYEAVAHRRTNYALGKEHPGNGKGNCGNSGKGDQEVPSAFNMQSGRL